MLSGVLDLPWWGYLLYTFVTTHVTIVAVTIYLHRHQAHRSLELHAVASHFFRFWLWLTTGTVTRAWAAIHRKHHAKCESADDPHSPQIHGIGKVFWEGAELYRKAALSQETIERYGHGTPDDWIERNVYSRFSLAGISVLFIAEFALFGFIGITIWAVQMVWIPLLAAGVINGIGHYWGYRNFQPADASRNIMPWGILVGGEELHNNHHAYATSAKLSNAWYEFDIGWLYICVLESLGLAQVKKIAPKLKLTPAKAQCDDATLQAIVTHRYEVIARYAKSVRKTCAFEVAALRGSSVRVDWSRLKRWLHIDPSALPQPEREQRDQVIRASSKLATLYAMREELGSLWAASAASKEQLVHQLEDWCKRAEASGIAALQNFSRRLRCYA